MTKKILSLFLAMLMALSVLTVAAYAEDDVLDPNALYGVGASDYLIAPDSDYMTLKTMAEGNPYMDEGGAATIIKPGETVAIVCNARLTVNYYPDADSVTVPDDVKAINGGWTPTNTNVFAFSLSGKSSYTDTITNFTTAENVYTVKGLDEVLDYTINYDGVLPEAKENDGEFLGWAVAAYTTKSGAAGVLRLYGVWAKDPSYEGTSEIEHEELGDPLAYIITYYRNIFVGIIERFAELFRMRLNHIADYLRSLVA